MSRPSTLICLLLTASSVACASGPQPAAAPAPATVTATATTAPKEAPATTDPKEAWRVSQPRAGALGTLVLPDFTEARLANGMKLLVSEVHALPIVSFALFVRGGSALDPSGKGGLTALAFSMLDEGAGKYDALGFADRVADLGAVFSAGASQDSGTVTVSGLARNADPMLGILADALLKPRLAPADFDREKKLLIASMERHRASLEGLAFERVPGLIYGAQHPYGHPANGTLSSIAQVSLTDVKAQLRRILVPQEACLVMVGDLSLPQAKALAERHLGKWKGTGKRLPAIPSAEAKPRTQLTMIEKPASDQTMIVLGRPVIGRGHPDELPLLLANEIFGGEFASRLNMNLREDKGYTYGAHSSASLRRNVGAFYAMAKVRADATGLSLLEFFGELRGMTARPPPKDEVDRARAGLVRSLPAEFERISAIAGAAGGIFVHNLPLDYFRQYTERLGKVTEAEVREAAGRYLDPEKMEVLLVGDVSKVQPQLEGLGSVTLEKP